MKTALYTFHFSPEREQKSWLTLKEYHLTFIKSHLKLLKVHLKLIKCHLNHEKFHLNLEKLHLNLGKFHLNLGKFHPTFLSKSLNFNMLNNWGRKIETNSPYPTEKWKQVIFQTFVLLIKKYSLLLQP